MANTTITLTTVNAGGTNYPAIIVTWTGAGTPPPGMQLQINNNDSTGQHWYGAWYENQPLTTPWNGWSTMNPTCENAKMEIVNINLANGALCVVPTWGMSGVGTAGTPFAGITIISGTQATANPGFQGTVSNLVIQIIGGGGGPE